MPRWAIFLFFPFILVKANTGVSALLFGEEEENQKDLDNQGFSGTGVFYYARPAECLR